MVANASPRVPAKKRQQVSAYGEREIFSFIIGYSVCLTHSTPFYGFCFFLSPVLYYPVRVLSTFREISSYISMFREISSCSCVLSFAFSLAV